MWEEARLSKATLKAAREEKRSCQEEQQAGVRFGGDENKGCGGQRVAVATLPPPQQPQPSPMEGPTLEEIMAMAEEEEEEEGKAKRAAAAAEQHEENGGKSSAGRSRAAAKHHLRLEVGLQTAPGGGGSHGSTQGWLNVGGPGSPAGSRSPAPYTPVTMAQRRLILQEQELRKALEDGRKHSGSGPAGSTSRWWATAAAAVCFLLLCCMVGVIVWLSVRPHGNGSGETSNSTAQASLLAGGLRGLNARPRI
jgi:hypothetical protein